MRGEKKKLVIFMKASINSPNPKASMYGTVKVTGLSASDTANNW